MVAPAHQQHSLIEKIEIENTDEAGKEDIRRAAALGIETDLGVRYFLNVNLLGGLASISLSVCACVWGFSPPAAILTFIAQDIGDAGGNASLFAIVWNTCCAISVLFFGRTSDKFGRRYFVIGATCLSLTGAIVASTAPTMEALIGANVLLGLASGIQLSYALLVGEICPNKYKWFGILIIAVPNMTSTGFGAFLARMLVETASWRWIYYIQIIMLTGALVLQLIFYKPPDYRQLHGERSRLVELKRVDWVGLFLLVAGLSLFMLGVSWGGQPDPWSSAKIVSLIVVGGLLLIALVLWDLYSKTPNPMVPVRVWQDVRGFGCLAWIGGAAGAMYIGPVVVWPAQVVRVYGAKVTSWQSQAWASTTIAFGLMLGLFATGLTFHLIKRVRYQLIAECVISTVFLAALASCDRNTFGRAIAFSTIGMFPVGVMELTPQIVIQWETPDADVGAVTAFMACFRTAVGAVMTAVFIAVLDSKVPVKIASMVPPAAVAAGLPSSSIPSLAAAIANGSADALANVPGMNSSIEATVQDALSDAYAASYAYVYYSVLAIGMVAIICAFAMRDFDHGMTGHVVKKIYSGQRDMPEEEGTKIGVGADKGTALEEYGGAWVSNHEEVLGAS